MPKAGFEPAITASEQAKTVHASDCSATATGRNYIIHLILTSISHSKLCQQEL
jgi:hypothetical protein